MDLYDTIRNRRSIRAFDKKKRIEPDKLERVLEAGRLAPSACNLQPWHFIVIEGAILRVNLKRVYKGDFLAMAPVTIVVAADTTLAWRRGDGEEFWKVDAAIAMEHIVLAAKAEGLGTCWIAAFNEPELAKLLKLPPHIRPVVLTPLGYPADDPGEITDRKPLEEICHRNGW